MGTNYATIVKYNGEEVVRQYGQTDGHPTTVIPEIVRFIQTSEAIDHLKKNVVKCRFIDGDSEHPDITDSEFEEISSRCNRLDYDAYRRNSVSVWNDGEYWHTPKQKIEGLIRMYRFSKRKVFNYILADRNTRCYILDALIMEEADKMENIYLYKARTNTTAGNGYFAVYTIDLDNECVHCEWLEKKMEFEFANIPTDDEIRKFECGNGEDNN